MTVVGAGSTRTRSAPPTARAAATGALLVHPYDHPLVVAGQGTMARELDDQVPGLDTVLVAVGAAV